MADYREGVDWDFTGWYILVFRLRTVPAIEIRLQPLAPIHFVDSGHLFHNTQERQRHSTVCFFPGVRIHRKVFARDIHHPIPPVVGGGYQGIVDSHSLDKMENTEHDHHDDDFRVVIKPGCAGHDRIRQLDMWTPEGFRSIFANPQCQPKCQWWREWEWGILKYTPYFWTKHFHYRITVRVPTTNLGQRPGRTERREQSTSAFRT